MVGAQARRSCRGGAVRVARGAAGRPRRGGGLGALHWHFVLGCCGDGVGRGLPFPRVSRCWPLWFVVLRLRACAAFPLALSRTTRRFREPELFFAPFSASWCSGAARRCLCRRPVPVLRRFLIQRFAPIRRPTPDAPCPCAAHSANPCPLCCSNDASRRRIAAAAIAARTDCDSLQTMHREQCHLSYASRVCVHLLTRSYNAQVQQQKWRASTDS